APMGVAPVGVAPVGAAPAQAGARQAPPAGFADLVEQLLPAVVSIAVTPDQAPAAEIAPLPPLEGLDDTVRDLLKRQGRGDAAKPGASPGLMRQSVSLGSGFVIDPAGYIVTSEHVISDGGVIKVTLHDERVLDARLVGRDPGTDLALLKVEARRPLAAVDW